MRGKPITAWRTISLGEGVVDGVVGKFARLEVKIQLRNSNKGDDGRCRDNRRKWNGRLQCIETGGLTCRNYVQ